MTAACGKAVATRPPTARPQAPPAVASAAPPSAAAPARPAADPIDVLIAASQARFDAGTAELQLGHLVTAKTEFNAAIDLILESPAGARANRRLQEHFDHLVDRISAFEIRSLAEGDGFAEKPTVPASLDELLAQPTPDSPTPGTAIRDIVAADLQQTPHDVPIPLNDKVLSYVEVFQGRLREWFQISLQRGMPFLPMVQNTFRSEGVPLDLAYIPIVESAFRTDALSRASAKGFWQLMRGTAAEQGLKVNWYIDERSNPEKATLAAAKYLKTLHQMFDGDWDMALASYNGGPGFMQRTATRKGQSDFWMLAANARSGLPRETREYVPMVLASIIIARNPTKYGFAFQPVAPPEYETVTLSGPVDLRRVAEWAGVPVDDISKLNPELRRLVTPVHAPSYGLRVPQGTAAVIEQRLREVPPEEWAPLRWYTVRPRETLTTIANRLRVRRTDLAEANNLSIRSVVSPGQKLVVPFTPGSSLTGRTDRPDAPAPASAAKPATRSSAPAAEGERVKLTYYVRSGDTLTSIARDFGTTVALLRQWNGLKGDHITPGQRLTLYSSRPR